MNPDSLQAGDGISTAYDSVWAAGEALQHSSAFERIMLSHDKLYVVLAVVLIIWIGLALFIVRTDKKLGALERALDERIGPEPSELPRGS